MLGDIEYISDTLLFEKLYALDAAQSIHKQAGIVEEYLTPLVSTISDAVKSNVDFSSTGATIKTVMEFLVPATLFRISPVLGLIDMAASAFGYGLTDIVSSAIGKLEPLLLSGQPVTAQDIQSAVGETGSSVSIAMEYVRDLEKRGNISALVGGARALAGRSTAGQSIWYRIFDFLVSRGGPRGAKGFAVRLAGWLIRTVLVSAGLMAGAATIQSVAPQATQQAQQAAQQVQQAVQTVELPRMPTVSIPPGLTPRGGTEIPSSGNVIYFDVPNRDIKAMLLDWIDEIYPQISGYEDIVMSDPGFQNMARDLGRTYGGANSFMLPRNTTRQNILNQFIGNVWSKIQEIDEKE